MNAKPRSGSEEGALATMVACHPSDRELIEETFANDPRFRDLCQEYLACRRALESSGPRPDLRQLEAELAEEARLWMLVIRARKRKRRP